MVNTDISNASPVESFEEDMGIETNIPKQIGKEQVGEVVDYEEVDEEVEAPKEAPKPQTEKTDTQTKEEEPF